MIKEEFKRQLKEQQGGERKVFSVKGLKEKLELCPLWPLAEQVLKTLSERGIEAFVVGGAVRDALLGKVAKDLDLVCSARVEELLRIFPKANGEFAKYGLVFFPLDKRSVEGLKPENSFPLDRSSEGLKNSFPLDKKGLRLELASFRKDSLYRDGRRPESVSFGSMEEDARRRDFTLNALFYDPLRDSLSDFVSGKRDLENRVLRSVGSAKSRFEEDRLRPLRALRFVHQLAFKMEEKTAQAVLQAFEERGAEGVSKERIGGEGVSKERIRGGGVSKERIRSEGVSQERVGGGGVSQERILDELTKMLSVGRVGQALRLLKEFKAFDVLFPTLKDRESVDSDWGSEPHSFPTLKDRESVGDSSYQKKGGGSSFHTEFLDQKPIDSSCLKKRGGGAFTFWDSEFSFCEQVDFAWTVFSLPFFYGEDEEHLKSFLKSLRLPSREIKSCLFYFRSLKVLSESESFVERLLAFNGKKHEVYELACFWFRAKEGKNLKPLSEKLQRDSQELLQKNQQQALQENLKENFPKNPQKAAQKNPQKSLQENPQKALQENLQKSLQEFEKREGRDGTLPKPLIRGEDLMRSFPSLDRKHFSEVLKKAFEIQMKSPESERSEILKSLAALLASRP